MQAVQALPDAPATDVANAFCNHGNIVHENAGADYARVEEGISLFRRQENVNVGDTFVCLLLRRA